MGSPLCSVQLFTIITMPYIVSMWFFIALCLQATLATPMGGGKCETTADCVAPNVCSKWGWCQWTKICGEEGPSQGSSAPSGGRAGQCKTSADCASRVPYCSKLGYCHGGTLPFDEEQLEIEDSQKNASPDERPIGYVNNNPRKNSAVFASSTSSGSPGRGGNRKAAAESRSNGGGGSGGNRNKNNRRGNGGSKSSGNRRRAGSSSNSKAKAKSGGASTGGCPGSLEECIDVAC